MVNKLNLTEKDKNAALRTIDRIEKQRETKKAADNGSSVVADDKNDPVYAEAVKGLSQSAAKVYEDLAEKLQQKGGQSAKAARAGAILFAKHADAYAKAKGNGYTAEDYYREKFKLAPNDAYSEYLDYVEMLPSVDLDEEVDVLNLDEMAEDELEGKRPADVQAYIKSISDTEPIPTADFLAMVGLPDTSDNIGRMHIVRGTSQRGSNISARNKTLLNLETVIRHSRVIEITPNTKKTPIEGLSGKRRKEHERKNNVNRYFRIMVPVWFNGKPATLAMIAEDFGEGVTLDRENVSLYEIKMHKKRALRPPTQKGSRMSKDSFSINIPENRKPVKVTIREMLTGISDAEGNPFVRGGVTRLTNGKRAVSLFESADESTFVHEMGHLFLMDLEDLMPGNKTLGNDYVTIAKWGEWHKGDAAQFKGTSVEKEFADREKAILDAEAKGNVSTASKLKDEWMQEKFARGFEEYLHSGKAPSKDLKGVFERFKAWLTDIYKRFTGIGVKPSPEVRAVMDRMITGKSESNVSQTDTEVKETTGVAAEGLQEGKEETKKQRNVTVKEYGNYNARRYGMPWIAAMDAKTKRPNFDKRIGEYTGERGEAGELIVYEPEEGSVYMYGQKDYRGRNTENGYCVYEDGEFKDISKKEMLDRLADTAIQEQSVPQEAETTTQETTTQIAAPKAYQDTIDTIMQQWHTKKISDAQAEKMLKEIMMDARRAFNNKFDSMKVVKGQTDTLNAAELSAIEKAANTLIVDEIHEEQRRKREIRKARKEERQKESANETTTQETVEAAENRVFGGTVEEADKHLWEVMGITPNEETVVDVGTVVKNATDEELERLEAELSKELNKLSVNPLFNPRIYTLGAKIGFIYVQRGYNTFKKWAAKMHARFGEGIEPWQGALWETINTWPKGAEFKEEQVEALTRAVGARYEDGMMDKADIIADLTKNLSPANKKSFTPLIEASYNGVKKFFDDRNAKGETNGQTSESASTDRGRTGTEDGNPSGTAPVRERAGERGTSTDERPGTSGTAGERVETTASEDGEVLPETGDTERVRAGMSGESGRHEDTPAGRGDVHHGREGTGESESAGVGGRGRLGSVEDTAAPEAVQPNENYHIEDPNALFGGSPKVRFARNKRSIEMLFDRISYITKIKTNVRRKLLYLIERLFLNKT